VYPDKGYTVKCLVHFVRYVRYACGFINRFCARVEMGRGQGHGIESDALPEVAMRRNSVAGYTTCKEAIPEPNLVMTSLNKG